MYSVWHRIHLWSSGVDAVSGVLVWHRIHLWSSGVDAVSGVPCLAPWRAGSGLPM